MMTVAKPASRPNVPHFSSGPCAKRPGWNPQNLKDAALGRSHRAKIGKAKLKLAIELTREVLEVPADYKIGIVPASDTGAVEMALWSLLGARRPHHLRRNVGRFRAAARFRKARCGDVLVAEGAGRRGRARHADFVAARGGAARELQAGLAAAEDFPADQGRQAQPGHLR